ncbi:MAG: hypothetical protein [Wendovervirus sonii]|uniref:Tetratricopeptide repeat protein n=1 Tax=phage Lak_Megaphage_Sonny TaxID=3109229 RepID=A0ABZ0Z5J7_9CAUD|nr:MAG: hypothetical protein [phage Lak_Megaphage_Sonny]
MKKIIFIAIAIFAISLTGCKIPKEFIDAIKQNPAPAEYHAGKVNVTFEGNFPEKYFNKRMTMSVTPVIRMQDGTEIKGNSVFYQGEKVKGNDDVIRYKVGGKYRQTASFDYVEGMEDADIYLYATIYTKKKVYNLEPVKISHGINITPLLVSTDAGTGNLSAILMKDSFQRVIEQNVNSHIMYLINQSAIRETELSKDEMQFMINVIKSFENDSTRIMKGIEIDSYASPDGSYEFNERLAGNRMNSAERYIRKQLRKANVNTDINSTVTPEDWDNFMKLVEASDIEDKHVIIRILNMYNDPDEREAEIKKLAIAYEEIANSILPELRRSKVSLTVNIIGKSDEEIKRFAENDIEKLNENEILYAATLVDDMSEKQMIYAKATYQYPNSIRSFNNLGYTYYEQRKYDDAKACFEKALTIDSTNAIINYNMGLVMLVTNNIEDAKTYFGKAGKLKKSLKPVYGTISLINGDYKKASPLFGKDISNNAALANILNKDYADARRILNSIENPNATTYYLKAILAARTNDKDSYNENMKKACDMDQNLCNRSEADVEFENIR